MADALTRVLVVDDHAITRQYFESTISGTPGYTLAASLSLAEEAVGWCREHEVDLILLDVLMQQGMDGLTAAGVLKQERPEIKIILTTSTAEAGWMSKAQAIGAEGFWFKNYGDCALPEVMDRVMAGERFFQDETASLTLGKAKRADLTAPELDVLRVLTDGATNEEIADALHISVNTARQHITNLLEKTGYSNRLELAVNAAKANIVISEQDRMNHTKAPWDGRNKS